MKCYYVSITLTALALLFGVSASTAQTQTLPTQHVRPMVATGEARLVGMLPRTQRIDITIGLRLRNEGALDTFLEDLHDPLSPSYGQYLSVQEFTDRFGPTQEDYDAVIAFAQAHGMTVTGTASNRLLVDVSATVASIEQAFHVTMGIYQHPTENRTFYAPDREPSAELTVPVWHIGGLDTFAAPVPLYQKGGIGVGGNTTGSGPGGEFLGSDRRAAYYGGTSLTGSGQSVGLFELDGYNLSDVNAYFSKVHQTRHVPVKNVLLLGASGGSDGDDTEQVIDIIEAVSMAPGMSQVLVYIAPVSSFKSGTSDTDIFNRMATDNIAKQISVSWAWKPADMSSDDPQFKELEAQGQNVFVASGDFGSYPNGSGFYYPAEDAYVVAVGGTDLTTNGAGGSWASETAWSRSGGGPSQDAIPIPSYQQLSGVINSLNQGSTTLRNVPDVAAEANTDNYYCANGTCGGGLGGTSLAAPTWAGFIALVNQQNVAKGKPTFGFLNLMAYPIGLASCNPYFHDITSGSNGAYSAEFGYDLVTGWGSPLATGWLAPSACVSPTAVDFGVLFAGGAPVNRTVTLSNDTSSALTIKNIDANGDFAVLGSKTSCGSTLASFANCSITVSFDPSSLPPGLYTGTLTVNDSAPNSPQTVSLKATVRCRIAGC